MVAAAATAVVVVVVLAMSVMSVAVLMLAGFCLHLHSCRLVDQSLSRVLIAVENHILDALQQLRFDLVIDLKHGRIYDRHVQTCLDGVVEECRVHCLSDCIISSE